LGNFHLPLFNILVSSWNSIVFVDTSVNLCCLPKKILSILHVCGGYQSCFSLKANRNWHKLSSTVLCSQCWYDWCLD
jgi:hypothetical protein